MARILYLLISLYAASSLRPRAKRVDQSDCPYDADDKLIEVAGLFSEHQGTVERVREVVTRNNCFNFLACTTGSIVSGGLCEAEANWQNWQDCKVLKDKLKTDGQYSPPGGKWYNVWQYIAHQCNP